ncbi:MAG: LuxR C-terminal-related transcriptional regulator [Nocardioides sp.]|uniref:helix-turn-helix transcriptional regulator n=1 Tax=Nocardioides sp. TaxID=35761 RepID=UPI0039E50989
MEGSDAAGVLAAAFLREQLTLRPDQAERVCAAAASLLKRSAPEERTEAAFVADAVAGVVGIRSGVPGAVDQLERAAAAHRDEVRLHEDVRLSALAALVALGLTRPQDVRPALGSHIDLPDDEGAADDPGVPLAELAWLVGVADVWIGDIPRGIPMLERATALSTDQPVVAALSHMLLGKALAWRGDVVGARLHLVAARELAAGSDAVELGNGHLECSVYVPLVVGDDEGFVAILELLATPGRGRLSGLGPEYRLELATAVAVAGDHTRARQLVADLHDPLFAGRPVPALVRAWADWVGDLDSAQAAAEAELLASSATLPAERSTAARLAWLLGSHAARQGRRRDAIRLLESAGERFTAMGALGYVRRIEREIAQLEHPCTAPIDRPDGVTVRRGDLATLTPAERRVAEAVSGGLSNREVAELLVLSERTVEAHLSSIFRKLGVRNRTQLAVRI